MKTILISFFFASLVFLIIDLLWLSFSVKNFYKPNLIDIPTNDKPILWAGVVFYLMYVVGLTLIIILPALNNESIFQALWTGIIFGIVAYGTYNLTNMAFIKNWSVLVVIVDTFWGGFVSGITAYVSFYLTKIFIN